MLDLFHYYVVLRGTYNLSEVKLGMLIHVYHSHTCELCMKQSTILDFKLSPCSECCTLSSVIPWRLNFICRHFRTHCLFHLHRQISAYEDGTDGVFRMSAYKIQMLGNYPEENIKQLTVTDTVRENIWDLWCRLNMYLINYFWERESVVVVVMMIILMMCNMRREEKPTRCHWMLYCTYNMINIFRALLCPSSGALDYVCYCRVWYAVL